MKIKKKNPHHNKEILDRNNIIAILQEPKPQKHSKSTLETLPKKRANAKKPPNMLDTEHQAKFIEKRNTDWMLIKK